MASLHPSRRWTVLTVFGTRPEIIKLAPVMRSLEDEPARFRTVNVSSGQHTDLLAPFVKRFGIRVDRDLSVMRPGQPLNLLFGRVLGELDPLLEEVRPDVVLVQGDTTTAAAAALAAFHRRVPVGHIEAGLRTADPLNPYPEETNRRLITRLARYHFAATARNRQALLDEGVPPGSVFLTGNPVVDALRWMAGNSEQSPRLEELLRKTEGTRRIALTTHRRESFGAVLEGNLTALRHFIDAHPDVSLIFPVHPNPQVRQNARRLLGEGGRVVLCEPLDYPDFIGLLAASWLVVSDSGGVQEECPSLGKPLLVLRETTERPEAVEAGVAKLVPTPQRLAEELLAAHRGGPFMTAAGPRANPFGAGDSGARIVRALDQCLGAEHAQPVPVPSAGVPQ